MNKKILPVYMAFMAMGLVDAVGPMVSLARTSFHISYTMAAFLPMLGYLMFGLLSIPMGLYQDKKGKKYILNLGLFLALLGLVIPIFSGMYGNLHVVAESNTKFYTILAAVFFLGAGASTLQVSGNPLVRDVSDPGRYSSNLSLAQSFMAVGTSLGFLLPVFMLYYFDLDWSSLFPIFAVLILICFAWLNSVKINENHDTLEEPVSIKSCFKLLGNRYVFLMVLSVFIYCGTELCMSANIPNLLRESFGISVEKMGLLISWGLFYLPILAGRLAGSLILKFVQPKRFLFITVLLALTGIILLFTNVFVITLIGILLIGIGFANIFPLIFSITIEKMPERANELSGLLVSAICGAAVLPPIMGIVADLSSIHISFLVPLISILYLLFVASLNLKSAE